jgi:hypothetical protein
MLTPSVAGNFRVICYYDTNLNGAWNSGEELRVVQLAIVRFTVESAEIDSLPEFSGGVEDLGFYAQSGDTPFTVSGRIVLRGGGNDQQIGVDKVRLGDVGNLKMDTALVNYPVPSPTPPAPGNQVGTEFEFPGASLPMLDTGNLAKNVKATGADTVFRTESRDTDRDPLAQGKRVSLESLDAPKFGPYAVVHPVTHNHWRTTSGGYKFFEYIVAYSESFPRNYVVLAKGDVTVTFTGVNSGDAWMDNGSTVTHQSGPGFPYAMTMMVTDGTPATGNAAGIQVLGLSYVSNFEIRHQP